MMTAQDYSKKYLDSSASAAQDRVILHCDMNGFFASVELLERPELRDVPMAVCGDPDSRHGIILAKNEPAKKYGIVTAETLWQARRKCPELVLVPPHMKKYRHYAAEINKIYCRYTDLVQPFSIDESWLDVTASQSLFGSGREIADTIRFSVKEELGLTLSAGVSFNKIFAKMGSEYKKPDATTEITRQNFRELLWPLPIRELFTVGPATAQKCAQHGIRTIGALAEAQPAFLETFLGKSGRQLWEYANGLDESPVRRFTDEEEIKSIGNGSTFRKDLYTLDEILTAVTALSDTEAFGPVVSIANMYIDKFSPPGFPRTVDRYTWCFPAGCPRPNPPIRSRRRRHRKNTRPRQFQTVRPDPSRGKRQNDRAAVCRPYIP